jgi:hypothetical protein
MAKRMRLAQFALAAVGLCMASNADAASIGMGRGTGVGAGAMFGHTSGFAMTRAAFVPRGLGHGRKLGFAGGHVPRGWSEGRKVGWHHGSRPPGLRR